MLYIRVDANPIIATGHVMRCLSIAKEVVKLGENVTFLTADQQAKDLIESNGFSSICLSTEWNNLDGEIDKIISFIQKEKIKQILIDSYYVTENYLMKVGKYTRILYIDDLAMFPYPVDTVINYNNYAKKLNYHVGVDTEKRNTKYLLGCSYAPLREEFQNIVCKPRMEIQHVLVTTGGSDSYHIASKFLSYIVKKKDETSIEDTMFKTLQFHVVVGRFNKDKKVLVELAEQYPQINLYFNVMNMAEIMQRCDLAITAGGSTMYELCACGVPMITYAFADNQLQGVEGFEKLGVGKYCGDVRSGEENLWSNIEDAIRSYMSEYGHRMNVIDKMKELVDGKGAIRLARFIVDNE